MDTFTKPEWNTERRRFSCSQNGHGHWWPRMFDLVPGVNGPQWGETIIRDSNPFKTLEGACRFVEKIKARDDAWGTK